MLSASVFLPSRQPKVPYRGTLPWYLTLVPYLSASSPARQPKVPYLAKCLGQSSTEQRASVPYLAKLPYLAKYSGQSIARAAKYLVAYSAPL